MSGAAITLRNVTARYEDADRDAVSNVSLQIEAGRFVTLLGPSGCGKTTLLRTINRLVPIVSGEIFVDGTNIMETDPVQMRRKMGYAIQAVGLFPHMTVAQNIAVVPQLLGWDKAKIEARVDEMLALVRLEPARYRNRKPRELSGGEAQRIGVARALAAEPSVLLMDEPFGALDAIVRHQLQRELLDIVHTVGTTTVFVTHDIDEALLLADQIVVMRDGRIEQIAPPIEILANPATPFVRELFAANEAIARLRDRAEHLRA